MQSQSSLHTDLQPCTCRLQQLIDRGVSQERIIFVNVVACPEGLGRLAEAYPLVRVVTTAVDPKLNEHKYIVPGLGDFGDRYFDTPGC